MLLIVPDSFAQNINMVISFGDSLYAKQNFLVAQNEYQRAYFFSNRDKKQMLSTKIADCLMVLKEFGTAKAYCDSALYYSVTVTDSTDSRFRKVMCYILEQNYGYALLKLEELKSDSSENFELRRNFLQGICYFGIEKYDQAFQLFDKAILPTDTLRRSELQLLSDRRKNLKQPSAALATLMSIVVPGSGQLYTGNYFSGFNSIVLLTGLGILGYHLPAFSIFIAPFLSRYYVGGILHANRFAKEKKKINQYHFVQDILAVFPGNEELMPPFEAHDNKKNYQHYVLNSEREIPLLISSSFLFYKSFLSSQDVDACVFNPSCSVYMMETIRQNGVITGFLDGLDRLLRCHSFAHKHDYQYNEITQKYDDSL